MEDGLQVELALVMATMTIFGPRSDQDLYREEVRLSDPHLDLDLDPDVDQGGQGEGLCVGLLNFRQCRRIHQGVLVLVLVDLGDHHRGLDR